MAGKRPGDARNGSALSGTHVINTHIGVAIGGMKQRRATSIQAGN